MEITKRILIRWDWLIYVIMMSIGIGIVNIPQVNGDIIPEGWGSREAKEAYRPYPILFLHGFAGGSNFTWNPDPNADNQAEEQKKPTAVLNEYFEKYFRVNLALRREGYSFTQFPYLETIEFFNSKLSETEKLMDRNSSVDTFKRGDHYVVFGQIGKDGWYKKKEGDPGWADKVSYALKGVPIHDLSGYLYNTGIGGGPVLKNYLPLNTTKEILEKALGVVIEENIISNAVGDGVVFLYSQQGIKDDERVFKLDKPIQTSSKAIEPELEIRGFHGDETIPAASETDDEASALLKLIDYTKPRLEIASPQEGFIWESGASITLDGKIYDEYLPADCSLKIELYKAGDNFNPVFSEVRKPDPITGYTPLKPSNLWRANDSNTPVAEFKEEVNLPRRFLCSTGTGKISRRERSTNNFLQTLPSISPIWANEQNSPSGCVGIAEVADSSVPEGYVVYLSCTNGNIYKVRFKDKGTLEFNIGGFSRAVSRIFNEGDNSISYITGLLVQVL